MEPQSEVSGTSNGAHPSVNEKRMDIGGFLRALHRPGDVFEIRALNTPINLRSNFNTTHSGYFDDPELAAKAVAGLERLRGPAVYVTLNPCQPDLIARARNRIRAKAQATTTDDQIVRRRWLLVDIDPRRPSGLSSTDPEMHSALALADEIREYLAGQGWPVPIHGMSGNGAYLLYRIDLPADDVGLVKRVLKALDGRFSNEHANVDTSTFNPARIVKILGTWARKGDDFKGTAQAEPRPHRQSWYVLPSKLEPVTDQRLRDVVGVDDESDITNAEPRAPRPKHNGAFATFDHTADGVEGYLRQHGVDVRARKPGSNCTLLILSRCPVNPDIEDPAGTSIAVRVHDDGKISYCNHHNRAGGCGGTTWIDVRDALEPGYVGFAKALGSATLSERTTKCTAKVTELLDLPRTDYGNAQRLVRRYGDRLRYAHVLGRWFVWDGVRWRDDDTGEVMRCAKETLRYLAHLALSMGDLKELREFARASESRARLEACIALARSEKEVVVRPEELDTHQWLFNVLNGTIDLKTGRLGPHRQEDLITKLTPVEYDSDATCPQFDRFLDEITVGRRDLAGYLQQIFGMALTGDIREQVLLVFHGAGANGKSTLLDLFLYILGPYAAVAAPDLLVARKWSQHPTEIADLWGKRLVVSSESEQGQSLRSSFVKSITGDARLKGRFTCKDFFEFDRTFKTILCTNNKPVIPEQSHAIWRRLRLVPFEHVVPASEQDKALLSKLKAEAPGVLAWAVRGCLTWQRDGLKTPPDVMAATRAYRKEQDHHLRFADDCLTFSEGAFTPSSELGKVYGTWCSEAGVEPQEAGLWGYLKARGCVAGRNRKRRGWWGVGLLGDGTEGPT